jgi:tetratricopeptide (TPR) repeat protein
MGRQRLAKWSVAVALAAASAVTAAQETSQKLFEAGNYGAVIERAASGAPEDIYLAGMAHLKAGNNDGAGNEFRRLQEQGDEGWKQIGASGAAMAASNGGEAVAAGRRATEASGDNPYAQYQLGLAAFTAGDVETAASALQRATELKPDFAYAHYYAGQAFQKQRNISKAGEHYQYFLKLAPDSPDRAAIQAIVRSMRG